MRGIGYETAGDLANSLNEPTTSIGFSDFTHKRIRCLAVLEPDDDCYLTVLILLKLLDVNLSVNVFLDDLLHFLFCDVLFPNHNLNILADDLW